MDQVKIGKYIAEKRRSKNMTQKSLAEQLMVSDKAVSKWERGICLPKAELLLPLSEIWMSALGKSCQLLMIVMHYRMIAYKAILSLPEQSSFTKRRPGRRKDARRLLCLQLLLC